MIYLDIETHPIVDFAPLLPEPVGCAILVDGEAPAYYSWGHKTNNNCTKEDFRGLLLSYWDKEMATHNGLSFDIPILTHHFNLQTRDPLLTQDTMYLAYLTDPHSPQLGLKWLAENWCGVSPVEQEEMNNWIMSHTACTSRKKAGAYIWEVPGDIAGRYACADVTMTKALFEYCAPKILPLMEEPYNRERTLAPILVDMQNTGVRVDADRLRVDTIAATHKLHELDEQVRSCLNSPSLNVDSNAEVIDALQQKGFSDFLLTPTGKLAANKDSLDQALKSDPTLRALLKMRATYATLVSTFMQAYVEITTANGGRLHPSYNAIRNPDGYGTRTGRLSSSKPNFQNLPGDLGPEYPLIRSYILPEEGHVWVCADFKNQEPRITAHFEDGALAAQYQKDPALDPYLFVAELCGIDRKPSKAILLGLIYAMGLATMAEQLDADEAQVGIWRNIIKGALPDVVALDRDCKRRFQMGLPIRTLGGRQYHCEPPKNGRRWEYKALNTLIQGSAADQTKEALIYVHSQLQGGERILGTVHDEISVSCTPERVPAIIQILADAANALPCDVPMLMDTNVGANWAEAK